MSAEGEHELKIVISPALYEKLQRLRGMLAHALPEAAYAELLEHLADAELGRLEKERGFKLDPQAASTAAAAVEKKNPKPVGKRVYLSKAVRRAVGARSAGRCEFETQGRRCSSRHLIEVDHCIPLARGGSNEFRNLRHVCRSHNLRLALEKLGVERGPSPR